jgi:hypothetical protein
MLRPGRCVWSLGLALALACAPHTVRADETDNFTCRLRPLRDATTSVDALVNSAIQEAVTRANAHERAPCNPSCLIAHLQARVGANDRQALSGIPHAQIARVAARNPNVDRCHLAFADSIYGARPYDRLWLLPFTGRAIWLADSIRLSDRLVGLDKINHFIREGLAHWRRTQRTGQGIAEVLGRERGVAARRWSMTESGLKGLSLTGVFAYADLAASYDGYRFWSELLSIDQPRAFIGRQASAARYEQRRRFTFADYVTDAWDEAINCSAFRPAQARDVAAALRRLDLRCPVSDCRPLAALPDATLYVNPRCLPPAADYRRTIAAPIVQ